MKFWVAITIHFIFAALQAQVDFDFVNKDKIQKIRASKHKPFANGIETSYWYEPSEAIDYYTQGKGVYRYQFVFPDTQGLVVVPFSTGTQAVAIKNASLGFIFDPRSRLYQLHPNGNLDNWNNYNVDSVWFYYTYHRFNTDTNVVDTLVVSFFEKSAILKGFENQNAAAVNYNYISNSPYGQKTAHHTILLHHFNENTDGGNLIIPLNITVLGSGSGNNWFGTAMQFKPGYTGYHNKIKPDTIANFSTLETKNSYCNMFRLLCYQDIEKFEETEAIPPLTQFGSRILNHGIVATEIQRYRLQGINGMIDDFYYPAFYANYNLVPAIDVHINTSNLNTNLANKLSWTRRGDAIFFTTKCNYVVCDLAGKIICAGNAESINLQNVPVGIFVLRVSNSITYASAIIAK